MTYEKNAPMRTHHSPHVRTDSLVVVPAVAALGTRWTSHAPLDGRGWSWRGWWWRTGWSWRTARGTSARRGHGGARASQANAVRARAGLMCTVVVGQGLVVGHVLVMTHGGTRGTSWPWGTRWSSARWSWGVHGLVASALVVVHALVVGHGLVVGNTLVLHAIAVHAPAVRRPCKRRWCTRRSTQRSSTGWWGTHWSWAPAGVHACLGRAAPRTRWS